MLTRVKWVIAGLVACCAVTMWGTEANSTLPDDTTLRRMAAQMLMVGFRGDTVDEASDAARYVRDLGVGAVILFDIDLTGSAKLGSRNITTRERLEAMTAQLQRWGGGRLLIALDQEGGKVARLKSRYGFAPTVSAEHLGRVGRADTTRARARQIALDLSRSGVNVNLAPVVDVRDAACAVLGRLERCFSVSPSVVAWHSGLFIGEHHRLGVLCTLKHFPGHGSARGDSHWGLVDVTDTWSQSELRPYQQLISQSLADIVMTAHIFNRQVDADYPATLSHKTITGLLREQMHYDGLVVSDDMYMQGIIDRYPIDTAIVLAINAGCDMLCVGNNINTGYDPERPFRLVETIVQAVKDGRIALSRLQESNRRIARAKNRLIGLQRAAARR